MSDVDADAARHEMIVQLDQALHGESIARDQTPEAVWISLLSEVTTLVHQDPPKHHETLDQAIDTVTEWLAKFRSANR